jgi:hypothetical protein
MKITHHFSHCEASVLLAASYAKTDYEVAVAHSLFQRTETSLGNSSDNLIKARNETQQI